MLQGQGDAATFKSATDKAIAALESYQSWLQQNLAKMPAMLRWAVATTNSF